MGLFRKGDHSCYFVQIPRTGSRYVSSLFENTDGVECKYHQIEKEQYYNIDVTHLHYPLYLDICPPNIPHITIVRNPYERFISSIRTMHGMHNVNYDDHLKDEYDSEEFIFTEIVRNSAHNNWFKPQHKFISPTTSVWKYEWGLGVNFKRWVYKKTKIKLTTDEVNYEKICGENQDKIYMSRKSQKNIKNFYKKDYTKFNYWRW